MYSILKIEELINSAIESLVKMDKEGLVATGGQHQFLLPNGKKAEIQVVITTEETDFHGNSYDLPIN